MRKEIFREGGGMAKTEPGSESMRFMQRGHRRPAVFEDNLYRCGVCIYFLGGFPCSLGTFTKGSLSQLVTCPELIPPTPPLSDGIG